MWSVHCVQSSSTVIPIRGGLTLSWKLTQEEGEIATGQQLNIIRIHYG